MRPLTRLVGLLFLVVALAGCHADPPGPVPTLRRTTSATPGSSATSLVPTPSAPPSPRPSASPAGPTATAPPPRAPERFYGSFTTYPTPETADVRGPGPGYRVVFSENLSRHGSRSTQSSSDVDRALAVWRRAQDADALTGRGAKFGPAVRRLTTAMRKTGYGELSERGEQEQVGLGEREGERLADYFTQVVRSKDRVEIVNTGIHRTETSAEHFVEGLRKDQPRLRVRRQRTQRDLHFGSRDPDYQRFINTDRRWRAAYEKAVAGLGLRSASIRSLRRLYTADFVDDLSDPVAEARAIWEVYRAQGTMSDDVAVDLVPFLDSKTAAAFAFDSDALWFYSRGPGITGSDRAHEAAGPLLHDFFADADERLAGGSTAAVYRFAHDTELVPFAARLRLPGSRQLASRRSVYSWDDNSFRLAQVAPMAANIEWTLWRDQRGAVLLQVRQNEVPTRLGGSCRPTVEDGAFYAWSEAKRCLGSG